MQKGFGRGKKLGFPTLNLDLANVAVCTERSGVRLKTKLKFGVYAAKVKIGADEFKGVLHYGPRPTFNEKDAALEVYCIGLDRELYGTRIEIDIKKRLRGIKKFKTQEELKEQIKNDLKNSLAEARPVGL